MVVVLITVVDMNHSCVAIEYKLMKFVTVNSLWSFEIYCVYTEMWELSNPLNMYVDRVTRPLSVRFCRYEEDSTFSTVVTVCVVQERLFK